MNRYFFGGAVALALTSTTLSAASIHTQGGFAGFDTAGAEQIWLAKGNNGKGNGHGKKKLVGNGNSNPGNGHAIGGNEHAKPGQGNGHVSNGRGKPEHAGGPEPKANGAAAGQETNGNGIGANGDRAFIATEREEAVSRIVSTPAPAGRDMTRVVGAAAVTLATPQLLVSGLAGDELIAYSNCPPGLAKKDPPCVPPGLAKKGVTYQDWASYGHDEYDEIWLKRREAWLSSEADADLHPELLLLQSDQIATLYGLDPAPHGQQYALIDGMPVLLDEEDYTSLLLVNQMAQVADLKAGVPVAPTAALTQDELINLYRLPQPGTGQSYAVLNGQLVKLNESEYELLQILRIARAVLLTSRDRDPDPY